MAEADKVALEADKGALTAQVTTFALLALTPAMTPTRRKAKSPVHVPNRAVLPVHPLHTGGNQAGAES